MDWVALVLCAFFAGFVDAVSGGGGLIQLPALLIFRPDMAVAVALGTNKMSSICGTTAAIFRYSRSLTLPWKDVLPAAVVAFGGSFIGARIVAYMHKEYLRPLVIGLLIGIFVTMLFRRGDSDKAAKKKSARSLTHRRLAIVFGGLIGLYDGFFGPGTGSFLIFVFVTYLGFDFLMASASAKIVNWGTNLAALLAFAWAGQIDFSVALPMAAANVLGGFVGSHTAIRRGAGFVRGLFFVSVFLALVKLISESW